MELSQDALLRILLVTLVAIIAVVAALLGSARIGRGRRSAGPATFDDAILSSSYGGSTATAWAGATDAGSAATDPAAATPDAGAAATDADAAATDALEGAPVETPTMTTSPNPSGSDENAADPTAVDTEPILSIAPAPGADDGIDPLTGLLDAGAFSRLVADEDARIARYHHPATVVVFELVGLNRLVDRLGQEAADRVLPAVATTIRRLGRSSDQVGRIGPGRFATLLPETDEVAAINYLERVRRACEIWLESGAIALRLAIGWAGTSGDPTLTEAQRLATERMYAEVRRSERHSGADESDRIAS